MVNIFYSFEKWIFCGNDWVRDSMNRTQNFAHYHFFSLVFIYDEGIYGWHFSSADIIIRFRM